VSRETYAAKQLTQQVRERFPDADATAGEPDGIGVRREVTYDKETSDWLAPLLDAIVPLDQRIDDYVVNNDELTVTFTTSNAADDRTPFPLDDVEAVLTEED
jgi:hypothetical protein